MFDEAKRLFRHYMAGMYRDTKSVESVNGDVISEWNYIFESMESDIRKLIKEETKKETPSCYSNNMLCGIIIRLSKIPCELRMAVDTGITTVRIIKPKGCLQDYADVVRIAGIRASFSGEYIVRSVYGGSIEIIYASAEFLEDETNRMFFYTNADGYTGDAEHMIKKGTMSQ